MNRDKPPRSWRVVAEEARAEQDSQRLGRLVEELNKALGKELTKQFRVSA